jgi:nitric oxide reductase subunit B
MMEVDLYVMVIGLALLLTITILAYHNVPATPAKIMDARGNALFTGADISNGQAVFLKYGLMDNGSI